MSSIYARGYADALEKLGMDSSKIAARNPLKMMKGLLRRKPSRLPMPTSLPSQRQISQSARGFEAAKQHPSEFAPWAGQKAAPPKPSNIAQFEAKLQGRTIAPPVSKATPKSFKRPEVAPPGEVPMAPPPRAAPVAKPAPAAAPPVAQTVPAVALPKPQLSPAEASAQVFMNAPEKAPKPGLLRRNARWAIPAAAVGGGAYALSQSGNQSPPQMPQQYYGDMAPQYGYR